MRNATDTSPKLARALALLHAAVNRDGPTKTAAALGIGRPTLWRWLKGKQAPQFLYVRHILETLK